MTETILVTGGNGFLALHIIQRLLIRGNNVRTTLRSLSKRDEVLAALTGTPHLDRLTFVQADLTHDADWPAAMTGIDGVMSVAAPVFVNGETTTAALNRTATDGTLRIIKAAEQAGVRRVVMTGNFGAVGFSNHDQQRETTEADWTDPAEPGLSDYERSKLLAEKAAWAYLKDNNSPLEFAVVNPGAMLGPSLDLHVSGSFGIIRNLLEGNMSRVPDIGMTIVDVRDAAEIHVRALLTPEAAGHRFIAAEDDPITMPQIASLIRRERPAAAAKVPTKILPAWLLRALAPFNKAAQGGALFARMSHRISNQAARDILGWRPESNTQTAILTAVDALTATPTK